jgi:hypothetical protein
MVDWSWRSRVSFLIIAIAILCVLLSGCVGSHPYKPHVSKPHLVGRVYGNTYTSSQGHFSVPFPVSPEVGGRIIGDNAMSVTFVDDRGSKISFYSREFNAQSPLMAAPQSDARDAALERFMKDIYGESIETHYRSDVLDGTLSFVYFRPTARTGVATFIHQQRIYLVETDLLPGLEFLSKNDDASEKANNDWLEGHAVELLQALDTQ